MIRYDFLTGLNKTLEPSFWEQIDDQQLFFVGSAEFYGHFFAVWRQRASSLSKIKFNFFENQTAETPSPGALSWLTSSQPQIVWGGDLAAQKKLSVVQKFNQIGKAVWCCQTTDLKSIVEDFGVNAIVIDLPKLLTAKLCGQILNLLGCSLSAPRQEVLWQWCNRFLSTPNLDLLVQLSMYVELVNASYLTQMPDYLKQFIALENKFFLLPNLLFSGQKKEFFSLWHQVCEEYPLPFWHSFWINAFYRSIAVKINATNIKFTKGLAKLANQKQFGQIDLIRLQKAVWLLYCSEYGLKTGTSSGRLEQIFWSIFDASIIDQK